MFRLSKMAVVLVMFALTLVGASLWAQPPDRSRPRRRARPRPESAAPKSTETTRVDGASEVASVTLPALPAPPIKYLETGTRLFNTAQFAPASKYLEAANRYRDQLQEDERSVLDAYLKELAKVQQPAKVEAPIDNAVATTSSPTKATTTRLDRPAYVVEPPDLVLVEVLEALPGRPISGERLVRPDGKISLGFYGEIDVAGLTIPEIKEKIVLHLQRFMSDEVLGLVEMDSDTGEPTIDAKTQKVKRIGPKDTDRVFVDVTAYNSSFSYVEGEVMSPGRIPYTGGDTVLDLIHHGGGLLPTSDPSRIRLIRSYPKGSPARVLPVDYEQITMGSDSSTNYPILPNDRLVVPRDPSQTSDPVSGRRLSSRAERRRAEYLARDSYRDRNTAAPLYFGRRLEPPLETEEQSELERRIGEIEQKLDRLLAASERAGEMPDGEPGLKGFAEPEERAGSAIEQPDVRSLESPSMRRRGSTAPNPRSSPRGRRPELVRPSPGEPPAPEAKRAPNQTKRKAPVENRSPFELMPPADSPNVPEGRSPFDDDAPSPPPGQPQQ